MARNLLPLDSESLVREHRRRVLVVDDDDAIRTMVERVLRREQFDVDSARNGFEAIDKLAQNEYGAILLDLMMPGADGMAVLRFLEESRPELGRSTIIMTAYPSRVAEAARAGTFSRSLTKPFDLSELVAEVRDSAALQNS